MWAFFQDAYTDSTGRLHMDRKQHYHLTDAWSRGHVTELVFSRKFETCDGGYVFDVRFYFISYIQHKMQIYI